MKYDELSIRERAAVIKTAVSNGARNLQDVRNQWNTFAEGGQESTPVEDKSTAESAVNKAMQVITNNRNKLDRKYDFIIDTWDSEFNGKPKGYNKETGLYFPYKSAEGGMPTVGPGLKVRPNGKGDAYSFTESEVADGVTKAQIDEKLGNNSELQYEKVLEFLNQKGNRLPTDTISPSIMRGLMDLRYQTGSLGSFNNLREDVLNGDLKGIKKESRVFYKNNGKNVPDKRRNQHRAERFWHYDDRGNLFSTGGVMYPFSFNGNIPQVRY